MTDDYTGYFKVSVLEQFFNEGTFPDCVNTMHLTSHSERKMKFVTITLISLLANQNPICHAEKGVKE